MRDIFFLIFLGAMFLIALKRPFLFVLTYAYIDIVSPQRLSYFLLNSIPISLIAFAGAFGGWLLIDNKRDSRFSWRQILMVALLVWCVYTTTHADFPIDAQAKWAWVWKSLVFAIFLPLTLRTRLRIEALALVMVLCASTIIVTGGIKTIMSGGGYGELNLMVEDNSGLYEGSTISMVAIAIIPLILWLSKHGTIFRPSRLVTFYIVALCGACLLIPIGTVTRTGLLCIILLGALFLWRSKKRLQYGLGIAALLLVAIPFLPTSFTERMGTIKNYQGDQSASTRVEVWKWTLDYVKTHPMGGGFDAYRANRFEYDALRTEGIGNDKRIVKEHIIEEGRAYHSAYFEMLGEQGYPGFLLWALIHLLSLVSTHRVYRLYTQRGREDEAWVAPLALALQQGHLIYLLGAAFVGIAYQPFVFMLLALQIGLSTYLARLRKAEGAVPIFVGRASARPA
ncbi:putative O-glycosylation ligase, exosortase A system-associated [Sphingobium sp. DEHP117]|uniref:putative O-glycosylation ligase, exosortase A system-associated n=1 Tax=Sphingobium sp. DEHP117 TaxID=2993436 RepID=UPI0027D58533|nr:putative O-glycosylation ligase, exosortase A system-associated [Sphingobium sp. DEHP117]MDQ4418899.1 putative O-glycosylation ligase, exosortase A system-associated [Sphingobium sp. DEHP117]